MRTIYFFLILLISAQARSQVLLQDIPDYLLEQSYSDLSHRALKRACSAALAVPATIPCKLY